MRQWLMLVGFLFPAICSLGQSMSAPAVSSSGNLPERRENYAIRCTTDASGIVTDSRLCYEGGFPGNTACIWIVETTSSGEEKESCISLRNACNYYRGSAILPTKAPDSIIGSDRYYCWRYTDCMVRNGILGNSSSVPDYYMNYGDKYASRFTRKVRPKLSPAGQAWLDQTVLLFQLATEALIMENGTAELNDSEFRKQLFDLHPKVYEAAGFFELSLRDKCIIALHIDARDVFSREGRCQMRQIARDYIPYLKYRLMARVFH
jgi:hypothetical protein